jgi:hypothetical protein
MSGKIRGESKLFVWVKTVVTSNNKNAPKKARLAIWVKIV